MTTPAIHVTGLNKHYGKVHAVKDLSLTIQPGEVVALLGPNGAGKTTTIDCALGLQEPDSGSVQVFGMAPADAVRRSLIGTIQQDGPLDEFTSVKKLLRFVSLMMPHPLDLHQVMDIAGITPIANRRISKCSGGEKQRIRLALALLPDPLVLFLDEPTTGMDVRARMKFWQFISEWALSGRAIVFATHYLAEAQEFAHRIIVMSSGTVVADESTDMLRERYSVSTLHIHHSCTDEEAVRILKEAGIQHQWEITAADGQLTVVGRALDDAARAALALPGAHNLELELSSVENAYIRLTGAVCMDDNADTSESVANSQEVR